MEHYGKSVLESSRYIESLPWLCADRNLILNALSGDIKAKDMVVPIDLTFDQTERVRLRVAATPYFHLLTSISYGPGLLQL